MIRGTGRTPNVFNEKGAPVARPLRSLATIALMGRQIDSGGTAQR
jgi:hypothetical protein